MVTSRQPPSVVSALGSMNHGRSYLKIWFLAHLRNAIDGTKDEILWDDEEDDEEEEMEEECDIYDDKLTEDQWHDLFGESDKEQEFEGF